MWGQSEVWRHCEVCGNVSYLVSWWFEPSQPLGIISGLKETFINRYIVQKTNKAETRPEE